MQITWEPPQYDIQDFFPKRNRYCVIVVVLNEGPRITAQLKRMQPFSAQVDIILADGRSTDGSMDKTFLQEMGVRTLLVTDERGLCTATRMGLAYALQQHYEGIITLDGNGKDGVEALPDFLHKLDAGYDLIQGSRFMQGGVHKNTPMDRYIGIRYVIAPIMAIGGFWYTDPTNAFRALSRRYLSDARVQPIRRVFVRFNLQHYLLFRAAQLGFKVIEIPVTRVYPDDGSVPSKIVRRRTKLLILMELMATVIGLYHPR